VAFEPEFRLAIECCRCSFSGDTTSAIAGLAENVDWERFAQIARFHRVDGLVFAALSAAGAAARRPTLDVLAAEAAAIAQESLRAGLASRRLLELFDSAGIPLLFVKGLTLGALAYGNPALKSAIDIDILIDPADLHEASELLRECGFALVAPKASAGDADLERWHRHWKESVWASGPPALQLDLHTRLADNSRLIPAINIRSPTQLVGVGHGLQLPTFATAELFAYLAVHGASSAWFRLKWISDFAGFVHRSGANVEHLYCRSQELGAGRAAGQALLLANELFGSLEDQPALRRELRRDKATVRLFHTALRLVAGEPAEPTERLWGTWPIHRSQLALMPGAGFKLSELASQLRRRASRVP
jgi:hypothetical protein